MTSEQREAAIERMARAVIATDPPEYGADWTLFRAEAAAALDALLSEFVVIAEDDVTEERGRYDYDGYMEPCWSGDPQASLKRLVTRWEPITKEDVGPWTTQETP